MPSSELDLLIRRIDDGFVVRPTGEVDLTRAPALRTHLSEILRKHPGRLIVDLSDVTYVDSPVVATLVEALRMARRRSCLMILCGLQPFVQSVLEISRVHETVFTVVADVEEALVLTNRRAARRVSPAFLRCDLGDLLDVSTAGVRLRTRRRPEGEQRLSLRGQGVDVTLDATVMWTRRAGLFAHEVGLRFVAPPSAAVEQLRRLVDDVLAEEERRSAPVVPEG